VRASSSSRRWMKIGLPAKHPLALGEQVGNADWRDGD
jgi:hypothetical protein